MIDYLRHMAIFARVVDEGSFRAAAQEVNLAPSRVSEIVSDLEAYLGITLLYRSTRKIALTNEGRIFYLRVVEMLRSAETGLNELNALSLEPVGALRVSVPAFLASSGLSTAMGEFVRKHPLVALSLSYTDRDVGLMEDGFDINIRVGWLDDSSMMARKLCEAERVLVAGTEYAASRPDPKDPSELEDWDWIQYFQRGDTVEMTSPSGKTVKVTGNSQIEVDNIDAMFNFAKQNLGLAILPHHLANRGIKEGSLQPLLPQWTMRPLGCFAVWPDKSRRENLSLLFVRYLADNINLGR